MNDPIIYRFANCVVDSARRQVRVDDATVEAQPKALDLLLYLIRNRERVVDKDELLSQLWPGVVVSESALTQAMRKARAMVGDDGDRQSVIRTMQRRGFRFVALMENNDTTTLPESTPGRAAAVQTSVIAVLPFTDMSAGRDQEYFCDGMSEEIINALTRSGLNVVARTSTFTYKNQSVDIREIGRRLGVAAILEGSVRKSGDRLRVAAQLVDAASGLHRWSESWDRNLADMFAIQDEIAHLIAAAMRERVARSAPITPATAPVTPQELYRRGLAYQRRSSQRNQRFALELFNQAIARDPQFALAWAATAISQVLLYQYAIATEERRTAAVQAASRAVELDPNASEAWTAMGAVAGMCGNFADAEQAFETAVRLGPESFDAHYYYGRTANELGWFDKAVALYERAAAIDADDYQAPQFAGQVYQSLGQIERAVEAKLRALAAAEHAVALDPTDARALTMGAEGLIHAGQVAEARTWIERACSLEPEEPLIHYNAACVWVVLGEHERALQLLEAINLDAMSLRGWLEHDSGLNPLRQHPRFEAVMARAR